MTKISLLLILGCIVAGGQVITLQPDGSARVTSGLVRPANQTPYTGPKGSVSGTVADSVSGTPVKKAQVHLLGGIQSTAVTDASGSFRFEQLPPGTYVIDAQHPSFTPGMSMARAPSQVTLGPGEQKTGMDVKVTPSASVSGHVFDEDGDPLPNCNLFLFTRGVDGASGPMLNATSNATGEFAIQNAAAGKYYLQVRCGAAVLQPRPFAPPNATISGPQFAYRSRYYPDTTSFDSAQKIKLTPGQDMRGVDFRMTLQKTTTVTVHVSGLDEEHRNRIFASLTVQGKAGAIAPNNLAGMLQPRNGTAQIHMVPPGTYNLTLTSTGPDRSVLAHQTVQVAEAPLDVQVQIFPSAPITGMLHLVDPPAPAPNPPNTPAANAAPRTIFFAQTDEQNIQSNAVIAPDGSFTLHSLSPGRYRANVSNGGFVQSVSIGGETTEGPEFELREGVTGPITVNVGTLTGTLTGEIQLGESHPVQIAIFALSGHGMNTNMIGVTAGQPVRYSIPLAPGSYRVYALEIASAGTAFQLLASDALTGREEKVDLKAGAEASRNLKLISAADIEKADQ